MDYMYNAWWNFGMDWTSIAIAPSAYFDQADKGMIVRFNYTENRELF
jgi:hypothetical protein